MPQPNFKIGLAAWLYAGGAHHTCFSQALRAEHLADFAEIAGLEYIHINHHTELERLKDALRWNEIYYMLAKRL